LAELNAEFIAGKKNALQYASAGDKIVGKYKKIIGQADMSKLQTDTEDKYAYGLLDNELRVRAEGRPVTIEHTSNENAFAQGGLFAKGKWTDAAHQIH
jgi:hypothetical protein